jgi:hypothetical protein
MDSNEILELLLAAQISVPPEGAAPSAAQLAEKIWNDGLVQTRAQRLMFETFAVAAVRAMSGPEKAVLRKRLGLGGVVSAPAREITWHVAIPVMPGSPVAIVGRLWHAELDAEGKKQIYEETRYHGTPEAAHRVTWKGSRPSADVVEEYQRAFKPLSQFDSEYYRATSTQLKPDPPKWSDPLYPPAQ